MKSIQITTDSKLHSSLISYGFASAVFWFWINTEAYIFLFLPRYEHNELKFFFQALFSPGVIINWEKKK